MDNNAIFRYIDPKIAKYSHVCIIIGVLLLLSGVANVIYSPKEINLEDHLQPLDVGRNSKYHEFIDDGKLCSRNCTKYPDTRICYFKLVVEQYHTMGPACKNCPVNHSDCFSPQCITADGIERTVLVFNRMLPGPAFHICSGDRVIVDLNNKMPAREVSIHWHGQLQKSSPWEDGVPFVTQCPVISNSIFRYDFYADTIGTHFYHSHSALQLFDGLSGAFIVRTSADKDPTSSLYDYDLFAHTISIRDWMHDLIDARYPGYNKDLTRTGMTPISYLINGMGSYMNVTSEQYTNTPLAEFVVKPNMRYRFRIIADTPSACSSQFAIEDHSMLLIATDGVPVQPVMVRSLYLSSADIYDVVVTADQSPRSYWIRVQGYQNCSTAYQKAILRYEESDVSLPSTANTPALFDAIPHLPELNNVRNLCQNNGDNVCLDEINSLYEAPKRLLENPDHSFTFIAGTYNYTGEELFDTETYQRYYVPISGPGDKPLGGMCEDTVNKKSNMFPPVVLLDDPENSLIESMKCPDTCSKHCECLNLIKIGYNKVTEMIFIDKVPSSDLIRDHPFHIHGHHFSIMKLGTEEQLLSDPDRFKINSSNKYPVTKHTVAVPAKGFAIVRFIADNPGFWLLHCHFTTHNDDGMQIVLQVGEPNEFPRLPSDWPKCGNYLPLIKK